MENIATLKILIPGVGQGEWEIVPDESFLPDPPTQPDDELKF